MASKRMIHHRMWEDETFGSLSSNAKILFMGLISHADDEGRGKANPSYIKARIFMYDNITVDDICQLKDELKTKMKNVKFYIADNNEYFCLLKWKEYQTIREDRKTPSLIPPYSEKQDDGQMTVKCLSSDCQMSAQYSIVKDSIDLDIVKSNVHDVDKKEKNVENIDIELSKLLFEKVCEYNPVFRNKFSEPKKQEDKILDWATDISKLRRIDLKNAGGDDFVKYQIQYVITWVFGGKIKYGDKEIICKQDTFWAGVIQSGSGLRKHFIKIVGKIKQKEQQNKNTTSSLTL
jgi:hypothetical protein